MCKCDCVCTCVYVFSVYICWTSLYSQLLHGCVHLRTHPCFVQIVLVIVRVD